MAFTLIDQAKLRRLYEERDTLRAQVSAQAAVIAELKEQGKELARHLEELNDSDQVNAKAISIQRTLGDPGSAHV